MDKELKRLMMPGEIVVNEINEETAQQFRDQLLDAVKDDPMRPVVVYIDSWGGELDALAKMIETMEEVPNPIITTVMGKAMSAGAILLSHGDMRFCGKHSRIMVHEASFGAFGDVHDVSATSKETKRLNMHFMELLANNCKIEGGYEALREMIKNQEGRDNFMDAEQALKFGIIDAIGLPKITKATIYQIDIVPPKQSMIREVENEEPKQPKKSKRTKKTKKTKRSPK